MPVRVAATAGSVADSTEACGLIEGLTAEHVIADKGYDSDKIIRQAKIQGMQTRSLGQTPTRGGARLHLDIWPTSSAPSGVELSGGGWSRPQSATCFRGYRKSAKIDCVAWFAALRALVPDCMRIWYFVMLAISAPISAPR